MHIKPEDLPAILTEGLLLKSVKKYPGHHVSESLTYTERYAFGEYGSLPPGEIPVVVVIEKFAGIETSMGRYAGQDDGIILLNDIPAKNIKVFMYYKASPDSGAKWYQIIKLDGDKIECVRAHDNP